MGVVRVRSTLKTAVWKCVCRLKQKKNTWQNRFVFQRICIYEMISMTDMPTLMNLPWVSWNFPSSHGLTAKAVKLTDIGYCEQWSVISNKHGFEASALMVLGWDHTDFYHARINYVCARADWTHQTRQRSWAWDWTGDHCVMAEASTDILVDEDGTHVSNCCVKICNVLQ